MNIAVVGGGVSGLTCAFLLSSSNRVTLFEREPRLGGHACTVRVSVDERLIDVDTGFIVYNERNYPGLTRLFSTLNIETTPTEMSFSVRDDSTNFEFGGASIAGLLGSPVNLLRPRWWRVMTGIARLGSSGKRALSRVAPGTTIGDLRRRGVFSDAVFDDYLVPMAAAIWSSPHQSTLEMPAAFFLRFFDNHGMLDLRERPQWRTVVGGSQKYVAALRERLSARVVCDSEATSVVRTDSTVSVSTSRGLSEQFDQIVLACHSDQALALLAEPSQDERSILSAMPFQTNTALLHTDKSVLPLRRRCWAAWNYRRCADPEAPVSVTYNLSTLQHIRTVEPLCVTLNDRGSVEQRKVLWRGSYRHPAYTLQGESARACWGQISGHNRTHFAGAYWLNGFHEDGVQSALRVVSALGAGTL